MRSVCNRPMNRQSSIFNRQWTSAAVLAALLPCVALAQRQPAAPALGAISFPNSGAPAAQDAFLRGVAWLHSFGYEEAIDAFREAQKVDPAFAMAYWGEALSLQPAAVVPGGAGEGAGRAAQARRDAGRAARQGEDAARAGVPGRGGGAVGRRGQALARPQVLRGDGGASSRSSRKTMRRRRSMRSACWQ